MKGTCLVILFAIGVFRCLGDASDNRQSPNTAQGTLAGLCVSPGFKIEIVASEPLIESPVAFEWGADGKLWVVEMRDYPSGESKAGNETNSYQKPGPALPPSGGGFRREHHGRIVFLEDSKHSGVYDKATVFLDGLTYPNSVYPWRKGVLVSANGEIFYAEDTHGDGKADVHKTILWGFSPGNPQHRVNGFESGLDNWVYAANGDNSGRIRSLSVKNPVAMGGCDLRFQPDSGEFELEAGCTQYGRHRDDWGNWFGDHNVTWLWHYFLPMRYLPRNSQWFVADLKHETANYPDCRRVYPTSPMLPRYNEPADTNQATSASSPMPYRDELFGPEYERSVFICDSAHSLVHREVLEPDGVTFRLTAVECGVSTGQAVRTNLSRKADGMGRPVSSNASRCALAAC